jgi:hypothetical protein
MTVDAAWRQALAAALDRPEGVTATTLEALDRVAPDDLDDALRALATAEGGRAAPLLATLAAGPAAKHVRRAARRALYRLAQRGAIPAPSSAPARPVVAREAERVARAWVSGIDGTGARAVWLLVQGGFGGLRLCSLIVSDTAGIVDAAGGDITKKRLARELDALRESQKLPWVEMDPERVVGLVAEALGLHAAAGTAPPPTFARWRPLFDGAPAPPAPPLPEAPDAALVERAAELLELPELTGWFLDAEAVQGDAVDRLQARESRLVVSDQIKAERETAIVDRVVDREVAGAARERWARRLAEMALVFELTGRPEPAAQARVAAAALADPTRPARHQPFARALATRALDVAGEVALGRLSAAEVRRRPGAPPPATASA